MGDSTALRSGLYAGELRREIGARNRVYARGRAHVESYGELPIVVYQPEEGCHGNFYQPAYEAICADAKLMRRFNKVHAQAARSLPRPPGDASRRWRELDSCMSSDALLMNVLCAPGVQHSAEVRSMLGVDAGSQPEFGWKARVPLKSGLFDRTEVDLRIGSLLIEAKLTESDFQSRQKRAVELYRDFDEVFDRDLLPRTNIVVGRRRLETENFEDYSQEYEPIDPNGETRPVAVLPPPVEAGYASYQLLRNVLAAYAHDCSFCVVHDERRPDLREAYFRVMTAVRSAELRVRLKVLTWQEVAAALPPELQHFLDVKYGIVAPGRIPSRVGAL